MNWIQYSIGLIGIGCLTACTQVPEWTLFFSTEGTPQMAVGEHHAAASGDLRTHLIHTEFIAGYYDSQAKCDAKGRGLVRLSDAAHAQYVCAAHCQLDAQSLLVCD